MQKSDYEKIIAELKKARIEDDYQRIKRLQKKLEKWQAWYGAAAPVN